MGSADQAAPRLVLVQGAKMSILHLANDNPMVYEAVLFALNSEKDKSRVRDDAALCEFDGAKIKVEYLEVPEGEIESVMRVSLQCKYCRPFKGKGLEEILEAMFGKYLTAPAADFDAAVQFDVDEFDGDNELFASRVSSIKRYAMGSPLWKQFKNLAADSLPAQAPIEVQIRPEESYWIVNGGDKVIVAYCIKCVDEDERVLIDLVLKGFNYEHKSTSGAPVITFSDAPPQEISKNNIKSKGNSDWLSVTFFKIHVATDDKLMNAMTQAQNLRSFVSMHVKGAKSYISGKMRSRIEYFEKVLDRAVPAKAQGTTNVAQLYNVGGAGKLVDKASKKGKAK